MDFPSPLPPDPESIAQAFRRALECRDEALLKEVVARTEIRSIINEPIDGTLPLNYAVVQFQAAIPILLDAGAEAARADSDGMTPLHFAGMGEVAGLVTMLIAHGADVNARSTRGRTPLDAATIFGTAQVEAALVAAGAVRGVTSPRPSRDGKSR